MAKNTSLADTDLVKCSTHQLKKLLEDGKISLTQHQELRTQRRRLQNRKYARKCAQKKQTEIFDLSKLVERESEEVERLQDQLDTMTLSTDYVAKQVRMIKEILTRPGLDNRQQKIRVLNEHGVNVGMAFVANSNSTNAHHVPPQRSSQSPTQNCMPKSCSSSVGPVSGSPHKQSLVRPAGGGLNVTGRGISDY